MVHNDKKQAPPPPPPPPPPSASPRYLLTVPTTITSLNELGIRFSPFHQSLSNSSRSFGAKVSSLDYNQIGTNDGSVLQSWINQYNLKVGDVIYKINDEVVKTRPFDSVINRLNTLFSEKRRTGKGCTNAISLIMERGDNSKGDNTQRNVVKNEIDKLISVEASQQDSSLFNEGASLSMELSLEHNTLHSIFATKNILGRNETGKVVEDNDHGNLSSKSSVTSESSHLIFPFEAIMEQDSTCKNENGLDDDYDNEEYSLMNESVGDDLSAIPEGVENDVSGESGPVEPSKAQSLQGPAKYDDEQGKYIHATNIDENNKKCDGNQPLPMTTIIRPKQSLHVSHELSCSDIGSPSFSYSDSEHLNSPVGTKTPSDAGCLIQDKGVDRKQLPLLADNFDSSITRSNNKDNALRHRQNFMRCNRRSEYMSPESENAASVDFQGGSWRKGKSVHFSSTEAMKPNPQSVLQVDTTSGQDVKIRTAAFQSPISEIHHSSSVGSCSISTVYLSPLSSAQAVALNTPGATSTLTRQTNSSFRSFHDVPTYMLDYNYVRECRSAQELQRIIKALEPSTKGESEKYPSLLRLAKKRLEYLTNNPVEDVNIGSYSEERAAKSHGIPSHIHVEIQTRMEEYCEPFDKENFGGTTSKIMDSDHDHIVIAHAELQHQMNAILQEREGVQRQLNEEIRNLQSKIVDLEYQMDRKVDASNEQIQALAKARRDAEEQVETLRAKLVCSSKEAVSVMEMLKRSEKEVDKLRFEITTEQKNKRFELEKAAFVQNQLKNTISNLTRQLDLHEEDDKVARELIDLELRSKYQAASQNDRAKILELEKCLARTRAKLNLLSRENADIKEELIKIGKVRVLAYFLVIL